MAQRGKKIDDKTREEIRAFYAACGSMRETARRFGVSHSTVKNIVKESDDFDQLRRKKVAEHIEQAWEIIGLYMEHLKKPETLRKATPHSAAVVIGTMWDKIYKGRELDIREREAAIKQRELDRREEGPSDEAVAKVIGSFVRALDVDPADVWEGVESEKQPEESDEA